ncbi:VanW family protein [Bacillus sp. DTU_2020_1000418_1_SI_GHA_SEK_038]|uniref:VanW family protein n=1 Tax=Bacillus sp. DTU_2020_1000418_1_SI_GHA_SEK_038 TaxID=3077585 RepID=UPI0028E6CB9C|nr:VanW family protein [Bacillus sp. DTU_2020_1000418_1_SI_GHA_SEK_038]WNS76330.1 VanW family protein [Bacillus sp. DTU_2020_1000418_1_SI_GHA_SEK_038]
MYLSWLCGILLFIQPAQPPGSLTIECEGESVITVDRMDYAISFPDFPLIDIEKLNELLEVVDKQTYLAPKNAYISQTGKAIAEEKGRRLHRKAFTDLFYTYFYNRNTSKIEVPMLAIHPRVDRDLLLHIHVKQIGRYVTFFNQRNKARSHNIALAAEAINNQVVFPGETFSFNRVVGKRTKNRGYMRAPVIVRGELAEDIGGGICQVSSTLFNSVDRAGLKIIERYSHSKSVPYVPNGRDAAVSWYGPDFSFKNEYTFPLLIRARASGGQIAIQIYSSDEIEYEPRIVPGASKTLPEEIQTTGEE